jgi:hypothetical protein
MAAISVKLRVVGIQFQATVSIDKPNPKIVDVMEAARASGFDYTVAPDGTLHQASALLPADKKSISSGLLYPAGLYVLADGVAGENSVTTWQWYIIRNNIQLNQPDGKTDPFSSTMSPSIEAGDEIIWRLVVVATRPRIDSSQSSFANKKSRLRKLPSDTAQ